MADSPLRRRLLAGCVILTHAASALALLYALRQIAVKSALYLGGLHGPDATLYWTMGTVIRNGLTIYRDVFDPKPPGMFLLSALSQSAFGDGSLGDMLNVTILIAIPLLFLQWGRGEARLAAPPLRLPLLLLAGMAGLTVALYNATIGGDWQTEFYGAFCGLLYVAAVRAWLRRPSAAAVIGACAAFSAALLLKEPFLLGLTAAAVLLLTTRAQWLRLWVLPLLSACATYLIVLVSLGALGSYIFTYLQGMLGGYIQRGGPVWARGLVAWERIWTNVLDYSAWFPVLVAAILAFSLPKAKNRRELAWRWSAVLAAFGILLLGRAVAPVELPWKTGIGTAAFVAVLALAAFAAASGTRAFPAFVRGAWRHALAFYLAFTAIGLGADFHGQYFAVAIPFYAALFLLLFRRIGAQAPSPRALALPAGMTFLCALVLLSSVPFVPPPATVAGEIAAIREKESRDRAAAEAVDAILDACGIDRYYFLEDRAYSPYARHSPLNFYLYTRPEHLPRYHPIYLQPSIKRLERAEIIVLGGPYVPAPRPGNEREAEIGRYVQTLLASLFTPEVPDCAGGLALPEGYQVLYRAR